MLRCNTIRPFSQLYRWKGLISASESPALFGAARQWPLLAPSAPGSRSKCGASDNGSWFGPFLAAAACAMLLSPSEAHMDKKTSKPKPSQGNLSFKETVAYLKTRIAPIRDGLLKRGHGAPFLTIKEDIKDGASGAAVCISLDVASLHGLGAWMSLLDAPIYLVTADKPETIGNVNVDSCEFSDESGDTTVRMENYPQPKLTIRRKGGFRKQDLDSILSSYEGICIRGHGSDDIDSSFGSGSFKMIPFAAMFDGTKMGEEKNTFQSGMNGDIDRTGAVTTEEKNIAELNKLGIKVFPPGENAALQWRQLAGYSAVKEEISDTVLNYLQHPEVYDSIARGTREQFESNRPRALLFEGPPGTGKTMSARIIAGACGMHMIHLPVESIVSKWYGESEKSLTKILNLCESLGGCVIFIDEIDAMAPSRGGEIHEATRRILSVLLQRLEGFNGRSENILVCATNRKRDLDSALISRFNVIIKYDLPDAETRAAIFKMYAKQLTANECADLSDLSEGLSGRGIKDVCEQAERKHASVVIGKLRENGQLGKDGAHGSPRVVTPQAQLPEAGDYARQVKLYLESHRAECSNNFDERKYSA